MTVPTQSQCRRPEAVKITEYPGYISGQLPEESPPITSLMTCRFTLTVPEGQRINVTLLEFKVYENHRTRRPHFEAVCNVYAKVYGKDPGYPGYNLCGGRSKRNKVYTSDSNMVTVELVLPKSRDDKRGTSLLKYQGKSILLFYFNDVICMICKKALWNMRSLEMYRKS